MDFDAELIHFLIVHRIPATIFATKKWLDRNPAGVALLKQHADLFEIEDHAVTGPERPGKLVPSEMPGAVIEGLFLSNCLFKRSYACPQCRDCFRHEEAFAEIRGLKEAIEAADLHRGIHV